MQINNVLVTPTFAANLLQANEGNRPLRPQAVSEYARAMSAGRWVLNGETVKVAKCGRLVDGQHRMHAVVKSGASVMMAVATDVPDQSFATVDVGMRRTAGQILSMYGEENASRAAALGRMVLAIENNGVSYKPTPIEVKAVIDARPYIRDIAKASQSSKQAKSLPLAVYAPAVIAVDHYPRETISEFYSLLVSGQNIGKGDPAYELRERFFADRKGINASGGSREKHILALSIKALRAHCQGKSLPLLRYRSDEVFPSLT